MRQSTVSAVKEKPSLETMNGQLTTRAFVFPFL
jgi:hypothetical protein